MKNKNGRRKNEMNVKRDRKEERTTETKKKKTKLNV